MRAYHRVDPLMDERKSHYSPAQMGAFLKVQLVAGRQTRRGYFRSVAALRGTLPAAYVRHVDFLIEQGDLVLEADGSVYVDGWKEWQEGDLTVRDRMAALRNRKRNGTVTSTVTYAVTKPSPTAIRSSVGVGSSVGVSHKVTPTDRTPPRPPKLPVTLTKEQLTSWESFGPAWAPFKAAWLARGFLYPPSGDPDGDDTTQRGLLWQVVDARPSGIAEWVRAAPKGATARSVVQYVLDRFHEVRASVSDEPPARDLAPTKHEAAESVGAIMERMAVR